MINSVQKSLLILIIALGLLLLLWTILEAAPAPHMKTVRSSITNPLVGNYLLLYHGSEYQVSLYKDGSYQATDKHYTVGDTVWVGYWRYEHETSSVIVTEWVRPTTPQPDPDRPRPLSTTVYNAPVHIGSRDLYVREPSDPPNLLFRR